VIARFWKVGGGEVVSETTFIGYGVMW
jgi:hypothetical protein